MNKRNKNLKKINVKSFTLLQNLYSNLFKIKNQPKILNSFSFKKELCTYNQVVIFYYQQFFLNFLTQEEVLSENFSQFKINYSQRTFQDFGDFCISNSNEEIFVTAGESLEDIWSTFSLSYFPTEELKIPLVLELRKIRENLEIVQDLLYDIHCFMQESKTEKHITSFENAATLFNQYISFLIQSFFLRNLLMKQCFSVLMFPDFFLEYFYLISSFDWEFSFFIKDFQKALSLYKQLYDKYFKN